MKIYKHIYIRKSTCLPLILIAFILSFYLPAAHAATERVYFRNLSVDDGLMHNWVRTIVQDRAGFIWIGTANGLSRFDGKTFRNFNKEVDGPSINLITRLFLTRDGKLWVGTDKGLFRYQPEIERFTAFNLKSKQNTEISGNVSDMGEDSRGNLWIAVSGQGLFCYNVAASELDNYLVRSNGTSFYHTINSLYVDGDDSVWVGCYRDDFRRLSDDCSKLEPFTTVGGASPLKNNIINRIIAGYDRHLYIATANSGVWRVNTALREAERLPIADGENLFVRDLCFKGPELWIATESGLYIYNTISRRTTHFVSNDTDRFSISDNAIYVIMRDSKDGMWLGSYFGGVDFMPAYMNCFHKYMPHSGSLFEGKRVRELCDDHEGGIYIGTEDNGLYHFDIDSEQIDRITLPAGVNNIHGLLCDESYLWVGTFAHGLLRLDLKSGAIKRYNSNSGCGLASNDIFSLCKTASGELWVGTTWGLYRYNASADCFEADSHHASTFVYHVLSDRAGNLWVATFSRGLYRRDGLSGNWTSYRHDESDLGSLSSDRVIGLYEDAASRLWVMSFGNIIDRITLDGKGKFEHISSPLFGSNVLYDVVEDKQGYFWITSNKGLYAYNDKDGSVRRFTTENGLSTNQFNYRSALACDGIVYLGTLDGFISFNPSDLTLGRSTNDRVFFSDLFIHNREARVGDSDSPLKRSLMYTNRVELGPMQNSFAFRVSTPDDEAVVRTPYEYRLRGQDAEWQVLPASNVISYSNVSPGRYELQLRRATAELDNKPILSMQVRVRPPLLKSPIAYALYLTAFIAFLYYIYVMRQRKAARRHAYALKTLEEQKQRELYESKIKFFTNIAHEIRTPLTLITSPIESVLRSKTLPQEVREDMEVVSKNTQRLLTLANQLLDFRKIEHRSYTLNLRADAVSRIVADVVERYALMAREKQLAVNVDISSEAEVRSMIDAEELTKIVSNLFSNAMKFADTCIDIRLTVVDNRFELRVSNDGAVVPWSKREKIFLPFEQVRHEGDAKRGTGLGLPLSRSLARLMGGDLAMEADDCLNVFLLTLPFEPVALDAPAGQYDVDAVTADGVDLDNVAMPADDAADALGRRTILVVDDEASIRDFLARKFGDDYRVVCAADGRQAIELLDKYRIALIITDVMMPEMSGTELCARVKASEQYCHIPVVMLTAKTDNVSKLEGVGAGADLYVDKPFSIEYLRSCVDMLIANRDRVLRAFMQTPSVSIAAVATNKVDEEFIAKLGNVVESHMADPDFSLDELAGHLNMSRSSLNRKIRGLLDLTPNDYIRIERLKRAAILLQEGVRINEVCYRVGFNTPSYFAKCFKLHYGVLPKDYCREAHD